MISLSATTVGRLTALALLILVSGCAVKRERYEVPQVELPGAFQRAGIPPQAEAGPAGTMAVEGVLDEWWRIFSNPELDRLVERALAANADLRIAALRVAQAQARAGQALADEVPVISAPVRAGAQAPAGGIGTVRPGGRAVPERIAEASLRADVRADLWGERRAMAESAERRLWRAIFQRDDAQRNLIANVVAAYLECLSLNDRIQVARETETVLGGILASVEARLEKGDATLIEMEQQRAAVFAVRATIPVLELQREEALTRLALLIGAMPGQLEVSTAGLESFGFPFVLPGVPSTLLLRRPDVRVAEAEMLAADADIDVARARVLPPLDLSTQIGYGSHHFSQMFQPHTLFWNVIANLSITIFDRGRRDREVDFARALHEELTEHYVRTVYGAVREVEDALAGIQMNGRRLRAQQGTTQAARQAWMFSRETYAAGAIDYLTLLDTERTYHRNLDELHRVRFERARSLVNLFRSLGGGVPPTSLAPAAAAGDEGKRQ